MDFSSIDEIRASDFEGFKSIGELQATGCLEVPAVPGVYLIVRDSSESPTFLNESAGGRFKGKNPTVSRSKLETNWVDGACVLYIGKAGGGTSGSNLAKRLRTYMRFGAGEPVGHWGGRLIWQLEGARDLSVCWRECLDVDAVEFEKSLIGEFSQAHGKRPFANLRD